jgi:hypothetical protein
MWSGTYVVTQAVGFSDDADANALTGTPDANMSVAVFVSPLCSGDDFTDTLTATAANRGCCGTLSQMQGAHRKAA